MRRLSVALAIAVLALPGCRIKKKPAQAKQEMPAAAAPAPDNRPLSVVDTADPHAGRQLVRGFYGIENQSWRWTAKNFSVLLRPVKGSDTRGATLQLKFVIPDIMFNRVGAMTIDARVNGRDLGAETFSKAGDGLYARDVPAVVLAGDTATFDFSVDKGLPPSARDPRELAIIVTSAGLLPK